MSMYTARTQSSTSHLPGIHLSACTRFPDVPATPVQRPWRESISGIRLYVCAHLSAHTRLPSTHTRMHLLAFVFLWAAYVHRHPGRQNQVMHQELLAFIQIMTDGQSLWSLSSLSQDNLFLCLLDEFFSLL